MVIKEKLDWFVRDVILEKNIKNNAQLFKQVKQEFGFADNVIYINPA